MIDKRVVSDFQLEEYLGKWYEIARYDHRFERNLQGVTAEYSIRKDGKIKVLNSGFENSLNGPKSEAVGKAKVPNANEPAKLKVSFFWIFYSDYFVLELDPNYQWAIVGSKSDNYLWMLSRTPQISAKLYTELLEKISARGYKVDELIKVKQFEN